MGDVIFWSELGLVVLLFIISAFFSAAETALAAVNKPRLKKLIALHPTKAAGFKSWLEDPNRLLTTILVGINIVNIFATAIAVRISVQVATFYGLPGLGVWLLTTVGVTLCIVVFCEVAPKIIAIHSPIKVALRVIRPIMFFQRLIAPFSRVLVYITSKFLALWGVRHTNSLKVVTEDDIRTIIDIGKEEGAIEKQEGKMLQSVLEFRDTIVREVMVPRNEVVMISVADDYQKVLDTIVGRGFSRVPVYEGTRDNIVGVLYAKDFLSIIRDDKLFALKDIYRTTCFVPETKKISELLMEFQRRRLHQAIVVDEYGGVAGLVTLEDIIEELVGEIRDEYDKMEVEDIVKMGEGEYLVQGRADIDDFNRELGLNLQTTEGVETLGGFVMDYLGSLPKPGKKIKLPTVVLTVKEVKGVKVESLVVELMRDKARARRTKNSGRRTKPRKRK